MLAGSHPLPSPHVLGRAVPVGTGGLPNTAFATVASGWPSAADAAEFLGISALLLPVSRLRGQFSAPSGGLGRTSFVQLWIRQPASTPAPTSFRPAVRACAAPAVDLAQDTAHKQTGGELQVRGLAIRLPSYCVFGPWGPPSGPRLSGSLSLLSRLRANRPNTVRRIMPCCPFRCVTTGHTAQHREAMSTK
jgi:hypothetical protein